ncbi:MAG: hypothetical protein CFH10_00200 [Alphaproteobacteria bacterium MarineAlpha4_Bin2]|nr:MAG: hypothetical protein CFH10_00200 [Alphaproteobacteria bacterium MarineAlpha4_Bin2]
MGDLSLDHVGFMVWDLDAGVTQWERLGFRLSRRSPQMGNVPGKEGMAPWATSNSCAMFREGYLELIGVTNRDNFNPWARFLDRFEGPHITALRCQDADAAYAALSKRIDNFDPPLQRLRNAPFGDGERPFKFRNIFSQDEHYPEGRFIVIEHQTPEVIWQEELMNQPNGAIRLCEVVFAAEPTDNTIERLQRISGGIAEDGNIGLIKLGGGGVLSVVSPDEFLDFYPGAGEPLRPMVAAVVVGVKHLKETADLLSTNGVSVWESSRPSVWVRPTEANGAVIEFIEVGLSL